MTAVKHDSNTDIVRDQLFLFIGESPIAFATSASLDISTDELDISNKMIGNWNASLPGKNGYTLSSESLLSRKAGQMSFDTLLAKQIAGETLDFYFGGAKVTNSTNVGGEYEKDPEKVNYTGTAMITSLSLKADNGQIASCSVSLKGIGALVLVPAVEEEP